MSTPNPTHIDVPVPWGASEPAAIIVNFTIPGEPVSKARARFTNYKSPGRMYTPEKTRNAEKLVALQFRSQKGPHTLDPEITYGIIATFHNGTRQRRDVDNMLKLLLDALNGVAWVDDNQVTEVAGRKTFGNKHDARTEVTIYETGVMNHPTRKCHQCGQAFRTYASTTAKVFCSNECRLERRRLARLRTCEHCEKTWDPGSASAARFCSMACRQSFGKVPVDCTQCGKRFYRPSRRNSDVNYCTAECIAKARNARRVKIAKGTCVDCGGGVSRREYKRCRACTHKGMGSKHVGVADIIQPGGTTR